MPFRNEIIPAEDLDVISVLLPYKPGTSLRFTLLEYGVSYRDNEFFARIERVLIHDDGSILSKVNIKLSESNEDGLKRIEFETSVDDDGLPQEVIISEEIINEATRDVQDFVEGVPTGSWQDYAFTKIVSMFNNYLLTLGGGLG